MEEIFKNSCSSSTSRKSPFRSPLSYQTRLNKENHEESPLSFNFPVRPPKFDIESHITAKSTARASFKEGCSSMPSIVAAVQDEDHLSSSPLNRAKHSLKEKDSRIALLVREITDLEQRYDEKSSALEKCEASLTDKSIRLAEITRHRNDLEQECVSLGNQIQQLEADKSRLENAVEDREQKWKKEKAALNLRIDSWAGINQQLQGDVDKLTAGRKKEQETRKIMSEKAASMQEGLNALNSEYEKLLEQKIFLEMRFRDSRVVFDAKEAGLREELKRLNEELAGSNDSMQQLANTLAIQKKELDLARCELIQSRNQNDTLTEGLQTKTEECNKIQELLVTLQSTCDAKDQELAELHNVKNDLAEKDRLLGSVKEEVLINRKNFADARETLTFLNGKLASRDHELEESRQACTMLSIAAVSKTEELEKLQGLYDDEKTLSEKLKVKCAEAEARVDSLVKELECRKNNELAWMEDSSKLKKQLETVIQHKEVVELKQSTLQGKFDRDIKNMTDTLMKMMHDNESLRDKLLRKEDQFAALVAVAVKPDMMDCGTQYINEAFNMDDSSLNNPVMDEIQETGLLHPSPVPSMKSSHLSFECTMRYVDPRLSFAINMPNTEDDLGMFSITIPKKPLSNTPAKSARPPSSSPGYLGNKKHTEKNRFSYGQSTAERKKELDERNAKFKPHLRSAYPAEDTMGKFRPSVMDSPVSTSYDSLSTSTSNAPLVDPNFSVSSSTNTRHKTGLLAQLKKRLTSSSSKSSSSKPLMPQRSFRKMGSIRKRSGGFKSMVTESPLPALLRQKRPAPTRSPIRFEIPNTPPVSSKLPTKKAKQI